MSQILAALRDAPHTPISSIKSYLTCPMKHAHRYLLESEPSHRSIALVLGSAVHEGIAAFYGYLSVHKELPPISEVLDALDSSWSYSLERDPPVRSDDLGKDIDLGVELMKAFHETAPRPARVIGVEHPFAIPLRSPTGEISHRLIVGAIDAVVADEAGQVTLLEAKTAKRRWTAAQLRHDIQPTIYKIAVRETGLAEDAALRFDFGLKLKTPVFESREISRTAVDETEVLTITWQVCRAVDAGIVYKVRGWACGDCEFAHLCG